EHNRGADVLSLLAFSLEFVADFTGADQDALGLRDGSVGNDIQEILVREVFNGRTRVRMAKHALGRKDNERLAPMPQGLTAQQMEILRGIGWLRDLYVVFGGELNEAFDSRAGMLGALPFVPVRQQHHES